jgi:hypothetical protein
MSYMSDSPTSPIASASTYRRSVAIRRLIAKRRCRQRGGIIIGVLFFLLIISMLLIGTATLTTGHQNLEDSDAKYSDALNSAEAGVNYEFRKISQNPASADQSPGTTYTLGGRTFKVYCTNKDGSTPWDTTGGNLYVISAGTVDRASRTVKVSVKGFAPPGKYAIYTMDSISIWRGSSMDIIGDVGSNGKLDFTSSPNITGSVYFNGPDAGWYGTPPGGYTVASSSNPTTWPTVSQVANKTVAGGLATLAVTNDNARAVPPIVGNSITNSVVLTAGNYYITNMNLTGNNQIIFDNRNGPVNIWIGPEGGSGTARFRGGTAAIPISNDATKACHMYVATQSGIDLAGNQQIDALIYAYNKDAQGNEYGYVQNSGNPTLNGQIIANKVDINGNITINYTTDLIKPTSYGYYGYDNSWAELNPR